MLNLLYSESGQLLIPDISVATERYEPFLEGRSVHKMIVQESKFENIDQYSLLVEEHWLQKREVDDRYKNFNEERVKRACRKAVKRASEYSHGSEIRWENSDWVSDCIPISKQKEISDKARALFGAQKTVEPPPNPTVTADSMPGIYWNDEIEKQAINFFIKTRLYLEQHGPLIGVDAFRYHNMLMCRCPSCVLVKERLIAYSRQLAEAAKAHGDIEHLNPIAGSTSCSCGVCSVVQKVASVRKIDPFCLSQIVQGRK